MRLKPVVFLLVTSMLLSACNLSRTDCARPQVFCVGVVTDYGKVDDHGLNQSAWEGVQQALAEELIDRADFIETVDARDHAKNIRTFLINDYDLIVTVGYSMEEETRLAAQEWTDRLFIGVNQPVTEPLTNLAILTFPEDQGGFLAGALAALISKTGKVAALCEVESLPSMWRYCEGFRVGVRYIEPAMRAHVLYKSEGATSELFNDPAWGQEQALSMLKDGVDVLFAAGGDTALGALEAAASHGALVIGADEDVYYQMENAEQVLSSAGRNAGAGVYALIRLAVQGQFPAGETRGEYVLYPYHELERLVPTTVRERLEQIRLGLANGSIQTGVPAEP